MVQDTVVLLMDFAELEFKISVWRRVTSVDNKEDNLHLGEYVPPPNTT